MGATTHLFVYGTLRDGDVRKAILGHPLHRDQVIAANAPGYTVVYVPEQNYPALVPEPASVSLGALLLDVGPTDLAILDGFEGDEYERRAIEAFDRDGRKYVAQAYFAPHVTAADMAAWSYAVWQREHKPDDLKLYKAMGADLRARFGAGGT